MWGDTFAWDNLGLRSGYKILFIHISVLPLKPYIAHSSDF